MRNVLYFALTSNLCSAVVSSLFNSETKEMEELRYPSIALFTKPYSSNG
jgi:hypothetical protein